MNLNALSPNYQNLIDKARQDLKRIENKGVSKAETLEDLRDTTGKSFKTEDLEKLMEKYDPEAYAQYSKMAKGADGARTQGGLRYLSRWIDGVKKRLKDETVSSAVTNNISQTKSKRTAADELAYLTKKYDGYSFIGANYTYGLLYGSKSTTNVAISPQFLAKMANDPELEKEYEGYLAEMPRLDEQFDRSVEAGGWHVVAKGWFIDKDGGIGGWCITQKDDTKSYLETLSENAEKIQKQKEEAKQEKAKLAEKRAEDRKAQEMLQKKIEEAGKKQFGDKFKGAVVVEKGNDPFEKFRIMAQRIASGEFQVPKKEDADGLDTKA